VREYGEDMRDQADDGIGPTTDQLNKTVHVGGNSRSGRCVNMRSDLVVASPEELRSG
jgi:hypothetical protein